MQELDKNRGNLNEEETNRPVPVSPIAIIIALILVVGLAFVGVYSGLTEERPGITLSNIPSSAGIAVLLILLILNTALGGVIKRKFKNTQIVAIYWLVTVGGLLMSIGFLYFNMFNLMGYQRVVYFEQTKRYAPFLDAFSDLILPKDFQGSFDFWLGGATSVPWGIWIKPIIMWVLFFTASMIFLACMSSFVYYRWTTVERLTFPLAMPIYEMLKEVPESKRAQESFWHNKMALAGILIGALIIQAPSIIKHYFPGFPILFSYRVDVRPFVTNLPKNIRESLLTVWPPLPDRAYLIFNPLIISVAFLVAKDISFSIWVCAILLFTIRTIVLSIWGPGSAGATGMLDGYMIQGGAFLGLAIWLFYSIRSEFTTAFKNIESKDTEKTFMSPRTAIILGAVMLLFMFIYAAALLHINIFIFLFFIVLTVSIGIGWARVRAEAGIPSTGTLGPFGQYYEYLVMERLLGKPGIGDTSLAGLHFMSPFSYGGFLYLPGIFIEGAKTADSLRLQKKSLIRAMILIGVVAMAVGYVVALPGVYNKGAYNITGFRAKQLSSWFTAAFETYGASAMKSPQPWRIIFLLIGGGGVLLLMYLRSLFVWWPISPIGFLFMWSETFPSYFPSFFLAWLIKSLVMRWGGVGGLKSVTTFFLGLFVGQVGMEALGGIIGLVLGF